MCCCCPGVKNANEIDPEDNPSEAFKTPRAKDGEKSNSVIAENTNKQGSIDEGMVSPRSG